MIKNNVNDPLPWLKHLLYLVNLHSSFQPELAQDGTDYGSWCESVFMPCPSVQMFDKIKHLGTYLEMHYCTSAKSWLFCIILLGVCGVFYFSWLYHPSCSSETTLYNVVGNWSFFLGWKPRIADTLSRVIFMFHDFDIFPGFEWRLCLSLKGICRSHVTMILTLKPLS